MKICVVTLFPELIGNFLAFGIPRKAVSAGQLSVSVVNPRDFATDVHRTVDGRPFGGGPGMVMKAEPLQAALQHARMLVDKHVGERDEKSAVRTIYLSPQGQRLSQAIVRDLALGGTGNSEAGRSGKTADLSSLILLAGRYEGIDERLILAEVDFELSIGDYVLSGGEAAALVLIDCIARLLPGVLGCSDSADQDSFGLDGLLDCPHYTRPERWQVGLDGQEIEAACQEVPPVLLSGDHKKIERWRRQQSLQRTLERRPDLLQDAELDAGDRQWLTELQARTGDDNL